MGAMCVFFRKKTGTIELYKIPWSTFLVLYKLVECVYFNHCSMAIFTDAPHNFNCDKFSFLTVPTFQNTTKCAYNTSSFANARVNEIMTAKETWHHFAKYFICMVPQNNISISTLREAACCVDWEKTGICSTLYNKIQTGKKSQSENQRTFIRFLDNRLGAKYSNMHGA